MANKKILLVDDDPEDQIIFKEALKDLNIDIQCETANNGQEALDHLSIISNYEMIFLDLNMPLMNGVDSLKLLKQHDNYKNIPVVIFTTARNAADLDRCLETGVHSVLRKPANFGELCNQINSILSNLN